MLKAMVFIDADWLCASTLDLDDPDATSDLQIDHRRLGVVLADEIGRRHHLGPIDVVRSHYFASRPHHADGGDPALLQRRREFLDRLEEERHVELEIVDPAGGRGPGRGDATTPGVQVAMTVGVMRHALSPGVLDLAIVVVGDPGYAPLLRELRRLGKRVALVSLEGSCARSLADPANPLRARDFEVVWLNDLLGRIEKGRGRRRPGDDDASPAEHETGTSLRGRIKNIIWDRGYGFIAADDGRDYFFHVNALETGLAFDELQPDLAVSFEVKSGPVRGRAGAARLVRRDLDPDEPAPAPEPAAGDAGLASVEQPAEPTPSEEPPPDRALQQNADDPALEDAEPAWTDADDGASRL
jgi:cold shock CspA family protein